MKLTTLLIAAIGLSLASHTAAQTKNFTVGSGGGMKVAQTFTFDSEAQFENFTGQTHKVTGMIKFDPKAKTGNGRLEIDLASIDTGIPLRNEHLRGEMWFNTAKHPKAIFETTSVKHKAGDKYEVTGKLTIHGVTKTVKTECIVRYLPQSDATKKAMFAGDVVNLKTAFNVRLADFGVMIPGPAKGKVAETIAVKVNVFGFTG